MTTIIKLTTVENETFISNTIENVKDVVPFAEGGGFDFVHANGDKGWCWDDDNSIWKIAND